MTGTFLTANSICQALCPGLINIVAHYEALISCSMLLSPLSGSGLQRERESEGKTEREGLNDNRRKEMRGAQGRNEKRGRGRQALAVSCLQSNLIFS